MYFSNGRLYLVGGGVGAGDIDQETQGKSIVEVRRLNIGFMFTYD